MSYNDDDSVDFEEPEFFDDSEEANEEHQSFAEPEVEEPQASEPVAEPVSQAAPVQQTESDEEEPYDWRRCTVRFALLMEPEQENKERKLVFAGTTHNDLPVMRVTSLSACLPSEWGAIFKEIATQLMQELPARQHKALERKAKQVKPKSVNVSTPRVNTSVPVVPATPAKPKPGQQIDMFGVMRGETK